MRRGPFYYLLFRGWAYVVLDFVGKPGWPPIQRATCLCLLRAGTKGAHHHVWQRT